MTPEPEFDLSQRRLMDLMSDLSEDFMCAGWLIGLENDLWRDIQAESGSPSNFWCEGWNGPHDEYRKRLDQIAQASAMAGGWVVWKNGVDWQDSGNFFLDWAEWGTSLGLPQRAELPERYRRWKFRGASPQLKMLTDLSRDDLIDLIWSMSFCERHLAEKISAQSGASASCLRCFGLEMNHVVSRVDYEVDSASGRPNDMECSLYDVECDPQAVLERLRTFLKKS